MPRPRRGRPSPRSSRARGRFGMRRAPLLSGRCASGRRRGTCTTSRARDPRASCARRVRHAQRSGRPDAVPVVDADLEYDACRVGDAPLHDGGERVRLDRHDVRNRVLRRWRAGRREHAERAQRKQRESSRTPQHGRKVGTRASLAASLERGTATRLRLGDGAPRLDLVRVRPVARRQVLPRHVQCAVLSLPDVAELMRDQVVR